MLDLFVKGSQLWEPGNKSRNIWIRKKWKTPLRMVCAQKRTKNVKKKLWKPDYKEPPFWDEFGPLWGPGSKYKPWI